ncbi:MAG: glycosyl transferase [Opitutales bacterium TMED158]|nr:MAG: glycosyl transferase [Opitutales bacterium TMED158]
MKLIIQIPCFNEEETLPRTLADLPKRMDGFDSVEWLVVDDGSQDATSQVARDCGVAHVVRLPQNGGLARAFSKGLETALELGADVIVNTDADNQYCGEDIVKIVEPILKGEAHIAIGARPIGAIEEFSAIKKMLQRLGSSVVRSLSLTDVEDAPSGFRAMNREAAMKLNVFSRYTYTLETIIQAGREGLAIKSVPIRVNPQTRPSRLVKSVFAYVKRSLTTLVRIFVVYRPMRFFMTLASVSFGLGLALGVRYLFYAYIGEGKGHVQSVIVAALLLGSGLLLALVALVSDLIAVNRKLLEKVDWRVSKLEDKIAKLGADGEKRDS